MAEALLRKGHSVTIVCGSSASGNTGLDGPFLNGIRKGDVEGIEVIELELPYSNHLILWQRGLIFLRYALYSIRIVLRENYDLVFATTTPLTAAIPGIFARWVRRKPFVFEVRDLWPELPKAMKVITNPLVLKALSGLEWVSYHSAQRLIGLSPGIVDGICSRGIPEDRVRMIPNGCDHDFFAQPAEPWRSKGIAESDLMAVFTGAHGLANGLEAVIAVAIELQRRNRTDIKLVLVGDGKLKPELQRQAKEAQLNNLIFLDPVPKPKLLGLLRAADLGMQILANVPAFYYGTSPNKFFDYLAIGLPILNNYPGWLADLITEHDCGFFVPPNQPHAFADALEQAADDNTELRQKGLRAKNLSDQFGREQLAKRWVEWLELGFDEHHAAQKKSHEAFN
jgi:glycosyltransferase involved in cell wall biosynthesis